MRSSCICRLDIKHMTPCYKCFPKSFDVLALPVGIIASKRKRASRNSSSGEKQLFLFLIFSVNVVRQM